MDLSPRISELLYHYDCVIVPELGGFVTEYRSARIDKLLHVIHPPAKDLRFNAQLKKNDGLLADALSRAEKISHEEANLKIKHAVEGYFTALDEGRPVSFDKVGILYLDSHKNIQFSPDTSVNYLLDSFRLKKVYAKPVLEEVEHAALDVIHDESVAEPLTPLEPEPPIEEESLEEVQEKEKQVPVIPIEPEEQSRSRKWLVAAALIPLLAYIGWVGVRSDVLRDGTIQMSDLNPFAKQVPAIYEERASIDKVDFTENEIPPQTKSVDNTEEIAEVEFVETQPEAPETIVEEIVSEAVAINTYVAPTAIGSLEYHVIGGCFSEESNAQGLVDKLRVKGFEAFIIDRHKGLHRVAYGSTASRQEALDLLARVKEEEIEAAWLLRKK